MSWQPRGSSQIAPDLFWRQEPGVDLNVRSEGDWQHGLRLYAAYDRVAGAKDIMETVRTAVELPESTGKVALQGYCLGALMAFITAVRYEVDAAVAYHGGDTEKYLGEVGGLEAPLLMHLGEEDEFISKAAQAQIKAALAGKENATVYSSSGSTSRLLPAQWGTRKDERIGIRTDSLTHIAESDVGSAPSPDPQIHRKRRAAAFGYGHHQDRVIV